MNLRSVRSHWLLLRRDQKSAMRTSKSAHAFMPRSLSAIGLRSTDSKRLREDHDACPSGRTTGPMVAGIPV